ncbi:MULTISPECIES: hypothetical protein [unclassified Variovorax]|uniref:hypothetical protein n=1 Tax=unclassified Variovorax TaxID=663243 RepID=UPI000B896267
MVVAGALGGRGLAWLPDDAVGEHLSSGRLVAVLEDWSQTNTGYHAHYATLPLRWVSWSRLGLRSVAATDCSGDLRVSAVGRSPS